MSGQEHRDTNYVQREATVPAPRAAAALAELFAVGRDVARIVERGQAAFFDAEDSTQRMAAAFAIIRFGEAAKQLPAEVREAHAEIPWRAIIASRDIAAHYVGTFDFRFTWESISREIPEVVAQLAEADVSASIAGDIGGSE